MPNRRSSSPTLSRCWTISGGAPGLVGLSISGLFAAQAHLAGAAADALVFINTLHGLRLDWINRAMVAAATLGGSQLVMEMNLPHLVNPEMLAGAQKPPVRRL